MDTHSLHPVTVTRQLNFVVALAAAEVSPYMLGALDAERGEVACPEMYFLKRGDACEYCEGFEAVAGPTLTTEQFLGKASARVTYGDMSATVDALFAPVVVDDSQLALDLFDYDAEADDYEADMLDRAYHASGAW